MIDYSLSLADGGMVADLKAADSLPGNMLLSLMVRRGSWVAFPTFGSRLHEIRRITADAESLAQDYCTEALAWLVKVGRLLSVDATVSIDAQDRARLNIAASGVRANGEIVTLSTFHIVA